MLVCAAVSTSGMAITTCVRGWQDFDLIVLAQTGTVLFSGAVLDPGRGDGLPAGEGVVPSPASSPGRAAGAAGVVCRLRRP